MVTHTLGRDLREDVVGKERFSTSLYESIGFRIRLEVMHFLDLPRGSDGGIHESPGVQEGQGVTSNLRRKDILRTPVNGPTGHTNTVRSQTRQPYPVPESRVG